MLSRAFFWRHMPIDAASLFSPLLPLHFLLSCRAGVAPCGVSTFAHCASWRESLHFLLLTVLCLVRLRAIATDLGGVTLSGDVAVVVATEALHHSAGAVIEFALVYLAFPRHSSVYDSVGRLWVCELHYNRGCSFECSFLGQPSYV